MYVFVMCILVHVIHWHALAKINRQQMTFLLKLGLIFHANCLLVDTQMELL